MSASKALGFATGYFDGVDGDEIAPPPTERVSDEPALPYSPLSAEALAEFEFAAPSVDGWMRQVDVSYGYPSIDDAAAIFEEVASYVG